MVDQSKFYNDTPCSAVVCTLQHVLRVVYFYMSLRDMTGAHVCRGLHYSDMGLVAILLANPLFLYVELSADLFVQYLSTYLHYA